MEPIFSSLQAAVGLFWNAFWALGLGYAFASIIQVFISPQTAARHFGSGSPKELSLAAMLGFISSSCSFAALAGTKNLLVKGAALRSALAYMFASTNLAVEVAALAYIFLGWQYALALFVGAPVLIAIQSVLVRITLPKGLLENALSHAKKTSDDHQHGAADANGSFSDKLRDPNAWKEVGETYRSEWRMVYKELAIGFLIAGFVATLVPASFFQALFPMELSAWLLVPLQAAIAPFISIITVIGSMGNGPLAAVLANNGIVFGAIMAFLYADFNVPPAVKINRNYYGWSFALYIAAITGVSAILGGIFVHVLFSLIGILPTTAKDIGELATFEVDYTFWLNLITIGIVAVLLIISRKSKH